MSKYESPGGPQQEVARLTRLVMLDPMRASQMKAGPIEEGSDIQRIISAHSSAYAIPTGEKSAVLVDAGAELDARNSLITLKQMGTKAVDAIFMTHGHPDHAMGLGVLTQIFPEVTVYVGEADREYLLGHKHGDGFMGRFLGELPKNAQPQNPDNVKVLNDGDEITIGERTFTAYSAAGHTEDSIAIGVDETLFIGDAGYFKRDGAFSLAPLPLTWNRQEASQAVGRLAARADAAKLIVPARSGTGPMESMQAFAAKHAD